jgi:hypothetical protein
LFDIVEIFAGRVGWEAGWDFAGIIIQNSNSGVL